MYSKRSWHTLLSCCALTLTMMMAVFMAQPSTLSAQEPWKAPADAEGYTNPNKATADSIAKGKAVFTKNCVLCHGEKGDGKGPSAGTMPVPPPSFNTKAFQGQSDGAVAWKILTGRGGMPSWAPVLQEDEVWDVINYVRQFGK